MILPIFTFALSSEAQRDNCILKSPQVTIHFGTGRVSEANKMVPTRYGRVDSYCPTDGHYTFTAVTSECFRNDWFTLTEDHTPGDVNGNMLLVNSSPSSGPFFRTTINGLKQAKRYEFSVWMMNVCRITDKCPFPLLPDITIRLQTLDGKTIAQLSTGEVARVELPRWTQYNFLFTTPASEPSLEIIMVNHAPGGCGNDFAMDDITFRECVSPPPPTAKPKTTAAIKKPAASKPPTKKASAPPVVKKPAPRTANKAPVKPTKKEPAIPVVKDTIAIAPPEVKRKPVLPPPPRVLTTRSNTLVRQIETEAGSIRIDLFDNGEIDDDTVSIYHNNKLLISKARLSQKPVTINVTVNSRQPRHELVMVAENLGSIPPNTSLMIVTAGATRHEVFISSTKQKNAKVVLQLKE